MIDYDDLIGIPFINGGRDRNKGFDCYGLVMEVYRRCGIALPEYTADWDDEEKINSIVQREAGTTAWHRVKAPLPVPCLVALRMGTPPGIVNHTGVYIGHGKFIHTRAKIGVCVSRIDSPAWRGVIDGFYEYVGDKL
ncbi:C40 family peptidase [uncultured Megasphaera sp.]|jgi:cell wall-associated NlpC family hydrolase|uniref:C40 family peptidase n=1 Tax=uncultured Megasphaera sp. TaxID=165188 RepID=UPI0020621EDA|nr:NlpC/P60 family protein [uncultured Megasphaera sp.]DAG14769.1 MAG TPA: cell wall-associated hydrolase [Caudoviricetes sp.]DAU00337.1 MAG TPA: cell wall-associated hydrolase [Caudoviricetes sp.]